MSERDLKKARIRWTEVELPLRAARTVDGRPMPTLQARMRARTRGNGDSRGVIDSTRRADRTAEDGHGN